MRSESVPIFRMNMVLQAGFLFTKPMSTYFCFLQRPGSESGGVNGRETTSEVSSKMGMTHINTAENYIAEVL